MKRPRARPRSVAPRAVPDASGLPEAAAAGPRPGRPVRPGGEATRSAGRGSARHQGKAEEKVHGVRACEALFARRPEAIIRVYVAEERRRRFARLLEHCAARRLGFQVVAADSLARLSASTHHEGIVILSRARRRWGASDLLQAIDGADGLNGPLVYLDGVQNPHNLGAILRTAAHFGAAAILGARGELPPLSPAAVRVAEGAAETVIVCELAEPRADLGQLKNRGYRVVTTSSHRGRPLAEGLPEGKAVFVLGSEGEGVSPEIAAIADAAVRISGTGQVESLNVSVACGVVLYEAWRRRAARPDRRA